MPSRYDRRAAKEQFERDGFVFLPGLLDAQEIAEIRKELDAFFADSLPSLPTEQVYFERPGDLATLKQVQQLGAYSPYFQGWQQEGLLPRLASELLDGPVIARNMQYFNKPPGVGQPTPPHQDGYYFMLEPCEAVTMWLALDDVDEENGCVRYIPGSHREGLRPHARTTTLGFSQGIVDFPTAADEQHERAFPAKPGDLLVHHALTIHRADGNASLTRTRQALGLIYYSERAQEDTAAQEAYQRTLAKQLSDAGQL